MLRPEASATDTKAASEEGDEMDEPMVDMLAERVDRLERSLARYKWIAGVSLFGLAVLFIVTCGISLALIGLINGQRTPLSRVMAGSFVVVDPSGSPRAVLGFDPTGEVALELRDRNLTTRSRLGLDQDRFAGLELSDAKGNPHAQLAVGSDGRSVLYFEKEKNKPRCMISDDPNGLAGFALIGEDGKRSGKLVMSKEGWMRLVFVGENEKARISMGMGPDDEAAMTVYDRNESIRIAEGLDSDDSPVFAVLDGKGNERLGLLKPVDPAVEGKTTGKSSRP
jgi:hypothetical protein